MTSSRKIRTTLSVALAASLFCGAGLWGQSLRRSPVKLGVPKQLGVPAKAKQAEVDQRFGRVVWADGGRAGVITQPYNDYKDWKSVYYACDERLAPVAILLPMGISHRNCVMFAVGNGTVERGDWVFIKQIPPSDEEEASGED